MKVPLAGRDPSPIRWGVLGVAKIATGRVIPAMQRAAHCEILAIASRDGSKAEHAASRLGIPRAYGSYDALLADPDIDAIYNPLPNHLHVPWTIRAAEAGKHVLCEKPIALNAAEARTLLEVRDRTGKRIQEAFMIRTHPQWVRAKSLVDQGRLGELRAITGVFSYYNADPSNVRSVVEWGGGGLLDIGCYLINTARFIFAAEPSRIAGAIERDPSTGVDRLVSMLLDFESRHAIGTCSTQVLPYQRIEIVGTKGRVEIEIPFNTPSEGATRLSLDTSGELTGAGIETFTIEPCDQFTLQAEDFAQRILEHRPPRVPLEDAVANMACIDAVFRSAATGRWEAP
ncbi:Gfo/Idh/MocA family oxidoreductase [soil metagenome]